MTQNKPRIKRALLSVSDKTGIVALAQTLAQHDIELISTGGTAKLLQEAGLNVRDVSEITSFPEMMDGRLKTLHPKVHGGLLALRDHDGHTSAQQEHGIQDIDLLVVNLYPFENTVASDADFATCIENIDIGGPAMIRAAAKNHDWVSVIVEPEDYDALMQEIKDNELATTPKFRRRMAAKAYSRTAAYDAAIGTWFADQVNDPAPKYRSFSGQLAQTLRYGENPHQDASFYITDQARPGLATAQQIQGKALSYNNLNDTDAALELVAEFDPAATPAIAIIKHANPCGVALGGTLQEAYQKALKCDPISAFGGIVAANRTLDAHVAADIIQIFTEVVIAPDATEDAKEIFAAKKNIRLLLTGNLPDPKSNAFICKTLSGGLLVQSRDNGCVEDLDLNVVTTRAPTAKELDDLKFAFKVCKHVKSNAIVYAKNGAAVGIGAGQMSRIDSSRIAASKAQDAAKASGVDESLAKGSVVASDAFFPFADGLLAAAEAGVSAVIQPGGSIRDDEVIAAANDAGLAMVMTGMRHFRH
ncbi:MAG: bifunctional phosphoribosylaminoimidazolecarboxamide formyltransferase/IMP cyclohydrolase [Pseudomonadota bacterium]